MAELAEFALYALLVWIAAGSLVCWAANRARRNTAGVGPKGRH